ncbi:hypothetical protein SDC9_83803 [bioreactor metagenome]|uniref:RNA polymerase sigma-70 region 2 domain-containing protein n=1 Tax=bioreactor metagenome TaxID=1076179 RepID=A0A644Z8J2_9ZZZZ
MDTITRNDLFFDYTDLIKHIMRRNRLLLYALRLEQEDVYQELAMAALTAIDTFDPSRSDNLEAHVWMKLQYKVLTMKRQYKPGGLTGLNGIRPSLCSIEFEEELGHPLPAPTVADVHEADQLRQALGRLDPAERQVVLHYLDGQTPRLKRDKADFASALDKLKVHYTMVHMATA